MNNEKDWLINEITKDIKELEVLVTNIRLRYKALQGFIHDSKKGNDNLRN